MVLCEISSTASGVQQLSSHNTACIMNVCKHISNNLAIPQAEISSIFFFFFLLTATLGLQMQYYY